MFIIDSTAFEQKCATRPSPKQGTKMIKTNCAACAAPLAHDAPRCVRCKTRYCNSKCQHDHWRRRHKQICKKIHSGGNAEQYHADTKYKEAVKVAVEKCVDDTKGQKCYICLEAVHPRTGEGLVRGCACGDRDGVSSPELGVAHVSCLARQAEIFVAEAEENNLGDNARIVKWKRWSTCGLCEQNYHGVVRCALGWACWETYLGQPEGDWTRCMAMMELGLGLKHAGHYEDALPVQEAELSLRRRLGSSERTLLSVQHNLANTYLSIGRLEESLRINQEIYAKKVELMVPYSWKLLTVVCIASTLSKMRRYAEVLSFAPEQIAECQRALGTEHENTLFLRNVYALALFRAKDASCDDWERAKAILVDVVQRMRRVLGALHPRTRKAEDGLKMIRERLGK